MSTEPRPNNCNKQNLAAISALLLVLILGCDAWVIVHGKVIDESGKPVAGAKIVVKQGDSKLTEAWSENDGKFDVLESIAPGPIGSKTIKLEVSKEGYRPFGVEYDWTKGQEWKKNDFVVVLKPL